MFWLTYKRAIIRQLDTNGNYICYTLSSFGIICSEISVCISYNIHICKHTGTYNKRVYQKVPRLDLQTRMYLLDLSLGSIPFKIVPLGSDTSIPAPLPLLERVLEVLFLKCTKNILWFLLDLLHSVKAATLSCRGRSCKGPNPVSKVDAEVW